MSIFGAMFSGVTGLVAQSQALGMIADNIANINTVGYKGTTARFFTLVTQSASRTSHRSAKYAPASSTPCRRLFETRLTTRPPGSWSASCATALVSGAGHLPTRRRSSRMRGTRWKVP